MASVRTLGRRALRVLPAPAEELVRSATVRGRSRGLAPADVLTVAYPKSGSTWLRFVQTHALSEQDAPEVDFDNVRDSSVSVGEQAGAPALLPGGGRLVKTHEPAGRFPARLRPRVVYLVRDGRDVAISYFHHLNRRGAGWADFDAFLPEFLAGTVGPYGPWQDHVQGWLARVHAAGPTAVVIRYEDMLEDAVTAVGSAARAIGMPLDPDRLSAAVEANSAERMRSRESSSTRLTDGVKAVPFVRAARAGQWRERYTPEQVRAFAAAAGGALEATGYPLQ